MDLKNLMNPSSDMFKILIVVIVAILVLIIYRVAVNQVKYNKLNPRFFPKGKKGKKAEIIKNEKIYKSDSGIEYSMFTWLYVDSIVYNYGKWKHILSKGSKGIANENQAPGIWMHPTHNNLLFRVNTANGLQNVWVEDFPIRKWFSLAIVVNNMTCELYLNGRLTRTIGLKGTPRFNNGDLFVNLDGGFDGAMSSIAFFSNAQTAYEIIVRHFGGPYGGSITENIVNYITGKASAIKSLVNVDLPAVSADKIKKLAKKYVKNPSQKLTFTSKKAPSWFYKAVWGGKSKEYGLKMHGTGKDTTYISLETAISKYASKGFLMYKAKKGTPGYNAKKPYLFVGIETSNDLNKSQDLASLPKTFAKQLDKGADKWGWYNLA